MSQENSQIQNTIESLYRSSAKTILTIGILTFINTFLIINNAPVYFPAGLSSGIAIVNFLQITSSNVYLAYGIISMTLGFLFFGISALINKSKLEKQKKYALIAGLALYSIDTLTLIPSIIKGGYYGPSYIIDMGFHIYMILLLVGYINKILKSQKQLQLSSEIKKIEKSNPKLGIDNK